MNRGIRRGLLLIRRFRSRFAGSPAKIVPRTFLSGFRGCLNPGIRCEFGYVSVRWVLNEYVPSQLRASGTREMTAGRSDVSRIRRIAFVDGRQ